MTRRQKMAAKNDTMLPQLKALKTTDISPLVRIAGVMWPRALAGFLPSLDEKQKSAFDQVMPVGGEKKMYLQLLDTPTPPIVIGMAQPLKMSTMSEDKVRQQQIKGIRLSVDDLQLLVEGLTLGNMLRLLWRLKAQLFTLLCLLWMLVPFLRLGPARLRDLLNKAATHFKPLFDLLPRPKKANG
jgi:hypothetical protein